MRNDGFRFVRAHVLQQTGAHSDHEGVTACARRKRVNVRRMVDSATCGMARYRLRRACVATQVINQRSLSLRGCSITSSYGF